MFLFLASVGVHVHLASASSFFCALAYTFLLPPLNLHGVEGSQDGANKAENSPVFICALMLLLEIESRLNGYNSKSA